MDLCFIPAIEKRGFISRSGNGKKQLSVVPSFRFCGNGSVEIGAVFREIKKLFLPRGIYFAMGKAENIFGGIPGALPKEIVKPRYNFKSHITSLI